MIKRVSVSNWKGINTAFELTKLSMLTGPNGSGKSAILEAIAVGLTGYTALGKRPGDTMQLASGKSCEITIESDDGHILTRRFAVTGNTVSQMITVDGQVVKASDLVVPESLRIPVEAIHPAEFLAMSGDKRAQYLFGKIEAGGGEVVTPDALPALVSVLGRKDGIPAGEAYDLLTAALSDNRKEIERAVANIQKLTGASDNLPAGTLEEHTKKLAEIDAQLEQLAKERATIDERTRAGRSAAERIEACRKELQQAEARAKSATDECASTQAQIAELGSLPDIFDDSVIARLRDMISERMRLVTVRKMTAANLKEKLEAITKHGQCPTCGCKAEALAGSIDDWDILLAQTEIEIDRYDGEAAALRIDLEQAEAKKKAVEKRDALALKLRVATDALKTYQRFAGQRADELEQLKKSAGPSDQANELAAIDAKIAEARKAKSDEQSAVKALQAANSLRVQRSQSDEDRKRHEAKKAVIEDAIAKVKAIRDQALIKASTKISEPFSKAVAAAFPGCCGWFQAVADDGKPSVDFGIISAGRRVSFDTMSGGERIVIIVALMAAVQIASTGSAKLAVVELAEADLKRVIGVASAIQSIGFGQAVLASCHVRADEAMDIGYTPVDMTGRRGEVEKAVAA